MLCTTEARGLGSAHGPEKTRKRRGAPGAASVGAGNQYAAGKKGKEGTIESQVLKRSNWMTNTGDFL